MNTAPTTTASAPSVAPLAKNNLLVFLARNIAGSDANGKRMSLYDYTMSCSAEIWRALQSTGNHEAICFDRNLVTVSVVDEALEYFRVDEIPLSLSNNPLWVLDTPAVQIATLVKALLVHNLTLNNVFSSVEPALAYQTSVRIQKNHDRPSFAFKVSDIQLSFGFNEEYSLTSANPKRDSGVF